MWVTEQRENREKMILLSNKTTEKVGEEWENEREKEEREK